MIVDYRLHLIWNTFRLINYTISLHTPKNCIIAVHYGKQILCCIILDDCQALVYISNGLCDALQFCRNTFWNNPFTVCLNTTKYMFIAVNESKKHICILHGNNIFYIGSRFINLLYRRLQIIKNMLCICRNTVRDYPFTLWCYTTQYIFSIINKRNHIIGIVITQDNIAHILNILYGILYNIQ